jgi:hypothetical protein
LIKNKEKKEGKKNKERDEGKKEEKRENKDKNKNINTRTVYKRNLSAVSSTSSNRPKKKRMS